MLGIRDAQRLLLMLILKIMNVRINMYMKEGNIKGNITSLNWENIEKVYLGSKIRAFK